MRHTWTVDKVTAKYVTLRANYPDAKPLQVPVDTWPCANGREWISA
jgi:hypothetical protein